MKQFILFLFIAMVALFSLPVHAGKVDEVKKAVKTKCNKDVPPGELVDAVVKAFDCQAQQEITVADCKIKCLKGNSGNVVGDR